MRFPFAFSAALAASLLCAPFASADDLGKSPDAPVVARRTRVLVFGENAARFNVERDVAAGRIS